MQNYLIYPKQFRKSIIPVERKRCFFLMPFSKEFDYIYGSIKNMLNEEGYICNRADEISGSTPILNKILTEIMKSQYVIVDLTDNNPNVFYELGISHTLKDAHNVLLLKQKHNKVPFDITHLTYIEYEPTNMKHLVSTIRNFLDDNSNINAFYDALNLRGIIHYIDHNNNDFIEYLQNKLTDFLPVAVKVLNNETAELSNENCERLLNKYQNIIYDTIKTNNVFIPQVLQVFYEMMISLSEVPSSNQYTEQFLNGFFDHLNLNEKEVRGWRTDFALSLARKRKQFPIVMPWIIEYFSRSKTANVDLNRYKIESFLMITDLQEINDYIIHSLYNDDCHIREHMSDIIGEKEILQAETTLYSQLKKEENFFTAVSMISAIGKLGVSRGIVVIEQWIQKNKKEIRSTNQLFVLKHALIAIQKLDDTYNKMHIKTFNLEFEEILKDYYIL